MYLTQYGFGYPLCYGLYLWCVIISETAPYPLPKHKKDRIGSVKYLNLFYLFKNL